MSGRREVTVKEWIARQVSDDEIARLIRWKLEATAVIDAWDKVYEALGSPGELGELRPAAALREVRRLKADATPPAAAQVMPVLAAITQAPAWGVSVDGRLVATCGREDDAHTLRRLINEAGGL